MRAFVFIPSFFEKYRKFKLVIDHATETHVKEFNQSWHASEN